MPKHPNSLHHTNSYDSKFYDLNLRERQKLVEEAISEKRTLLSRWQSLSSEQTESWALRAQRAASMIGRQAAVVDLGCGMMELERYLPPTTTYVPVDVVWRDERTTIVDLNRQDLPDLGADCVAGLGILEYIFDLPKLLQRMSAR